jgi:FkbM family methyltransferase
MEFGTGDAFRSPGWIERVAAILRGPVGRSPLKEPLKRACEAVLDRLPGDRLVSRFPHGESVRLAAAFRQVVWNNEEYAAFRRDIAPGDVVFDIGANLGGYTMLFAQWVGATGRVFAFEPAPDARRGLVRHAALNAVGDRVVVRAEAVSARTGTARFQAAGLQGDNRLVAAATDGIEVETTSVDDFCRARGLRPALIKIDAEGAELDVLKGARETVAAAGRTMALYVELHPHLWPALGYSRADVEAELGLQRLRPERIDGHSDPWAIAGVCVRLRRCES